MGIRESFEEHPLGDELNIHDIAINDEKRETLAFDPETEITDTDREAMKEKLEVLRREFRAWNPMALYTHAMNIAILFPDLIPESDLDDIWQKLKVPLEKSRKNKEWLNFAEEAMAMKIICPNRASELDLNDEVWQDMKEDFRKYRGISSYAIAMRTIFPNRASELNLSNEDIKKLSAESRNDWWNFSWQAARMKILFPDRSAEIGLNDQDWSGMKGLLEAQRQRKNWSDFSAMAANMKILAADKVKITDRGFEITMRKKKDFHKPKTPRPVRRQF